MRIKSGRPVVSLRLPALFRWLVLCSASFCLLCISMYKFPDRLPLPLQKGMWMWRSFFRPSFTVDYRGNSFVMNGERIRIMSGAIHYFRILPDLWEDRLKTMQASGLNTIETYVEWSSHEPEPGQYDFEGQQDLVRFLKIAHRLGFMVILRPGPYICAERDMGGLPYWLLRNGSSIKLRTMDENYIYYVDRYLIKVFEKVRPLLFKNHGPIIMVQLENEYGSYEACDGNYTLHLKNLTITHLGRHVVLFTTDGAFDDTMIKCGRVKGTLTTVDFGAGSDVQNATLVRRRYQPSGPFMNSEMYTGWLDNWGLPKSRVDTPVLIDTLRQLLDMGASFNLYMFHGGTNFGFKSGANDNGAFQPQITSYDYDAPLTEAGDTTDKFKAIRELIDKVYPGRVTAPVPRPKKKMALYGITMKRMFGLKTLRQLMNHTVQSTYPLTFERVGHAYGLMLYETIAPSKVGVSPLLKVPGIRDRGYIYVDDVFKAIISRSDQLFEAIIEIKTGQRLSILVENQGRINMGAIVDPKGIVENVTIESMVLKKWTMRPINLAQGSWLRDYRALKQLVDPREPVTNKGFAVFAADFRLPEGKRIYDTFLLIQMFKKGTALLNGFNLGRYWTSAGPQKALYVPSVLFRRGANLLLLLEQEAVQCNSSKSRPCTVDFVSNRHFDGPLHWSV
ncbi:beta-galactosidase-like [Rhipicephalus microplus]|uniref:beta-galactosidase-like n=1 Tax=Rhipicephalus microplus TaxID=6941 RepID=UPI003F6C2EFE